MDQTRNGTSKSENLLNVFNTVDQMNNKKSFLIFKICGLSTSEIDPKDYFSQSTEIYAAVYVLLSKQQRKLIHLPLIVC